MIQIINRIINSLKTSTEILDCSIPQSTLEHSSRIVNEILGFIGLFSPEGLMSVKEITAYAGLMNIMNKINTKQSFII